jgi:hypothetical protein
MLDFTPVRNKQKTIAELSANLTVDDLHRLTDEMVDAQLRLIDGVTDADVIFVPLDPAANDTFAANKDDVHIAWTLGHLIVHATASSEEAAALSTELARGVEVKGRSRSEVPWQTVHRAAQLRERLEESRRMRHAFLNAWPGQPNLTLTFTAGYPGATPVNAVGRFVNGLSHDDSHLRQIAEVVRQAREARAAVAGA